MADVYTLMREREQLQGEIKDLQTDMTDLQQRVDALKAQNEGLYRMLRQRANKDRKTPQSGSGYVIRYAEQRQDRITMLRLGICKQTEQMYPSWRIRVQTPYKGDDPAVIKQAVLHDLEQYGYDCLVEPVDDMFDDLDKLLATHPVFRVLLRAVPGDYWECDVYSLVYFGALDMRSEYDIAHLDPRKPEYGGAKGANHEKDE